MIMKFLCSFKKLPLDWYRLVLVGWIVIPIISALIFEEIFVNVLSEAIFLCVVLYYPLIRIILWVRDGFKNQSTYKSLSQPKIFLTYKSINEL